MLTYFQQDRSYPDVLRKRYMHNKLSRQVMSLPLILEHMYDTHLVIDTRLREDSSVIPLVPWLNNPLRVLRNRQVEPMHAS